MKLRVVVAQINCLVGDVAGNVERILGASANARDDYKADLVVFPELSLTGYPPEDLLLRPELIERVEAGLETLKQQARGVDVVVGYPYVQGGRLKNAAGVIRDGCIIAQYYKQHLPNYSVFDEKRYFAAGSESCVYEQQGVKIGLTICEDIWQDGPAREVAEAGAQILLNINASPYHTGKAPEREELLSRRARDHGLPIIYANLVGGQDELVFDGGSFVVDADGEFTHRAGFYEELLMPVDLEIGDCVRPIRGERAALPDEDEAVYSALVLGVRDYVRKNGFHGAVLGLSGGIDSALTLAIAADALGPDQVEVVLMPSRYTADISIDDALEEARTLGVKHSVIPIEPAFQAFLGMLDEELAGRPVDATEENIQARCRGIILMAISNKKGKILLTTGNKSEMAVGYATLYGDMAGGFAPIKDVFKQLVYRLSRYRNRVSHVIPERVIARPPSAELAPDQTDQDTLPPYEVLDRVLERYIEWDQSVAQIVGAGFSRQDVQRIARMVDRNEYKRRQAPPGVRITSRAFGRDRRYPITSGFGSS